MTTADETKNDQPVVVIPDAAASSSTGCSGSDCPAAAAFWATVDGANRYAVLYRIQDAAKPETRARRIAHFVDMLEHGRVLHG